MKQNFLILPRTGDGESAGIPKRLVNPNLFLNSGEGGFRCEGDDYCSVRSRVVRIFVQNGVIPLTVKVLPCAADHLRARVLGKRG